MKVKNIAFSGFMAAIMLSVTGAANAAVQIASQAYVDAQDTATVTTAVNQAVTQVENKGYLTETAAGNTYLTKTDAAATYVTEEGATTVVENTLKNTETITQILTDTENGLGKELAAKADQSAVDALNSSVGALETTVGDETSGLVKDVADAAAAAAKAQGDVNTLAGVVNNETTGLATKASQTDLTALTGRVSTNETNIGALQTKVGTAELSTTAKNIAEAINELKTKTDGMATEGNFNEMNNKITGLETSVGALETAVGDETSGLTKDVADNKSDIATLKAGADVTGSVANTATGIVTGYAVPKPKAGDCDAESELCLLSVKSDGTLQWVAVTKPAE